MLCVKYNINLVHVVGVTDLLISIMFDYFFNAFLLQFQSQFFFCNTTRKMHI